MFERFSDAARQAVIGAQDEARRAGADEIEAEHLLLALLRGGDETVRHLIGVDGPGADEAAEEFDRVRRRGGLTDADADALGSIGVDVDHVVDRVEEALGPRALTARSGRRRFLRGHIPFTAEAKRVLEWSLREAMELNDRRIGVEHLLLALLVRGKAADVLGARGVNRQTVRARLARAS